ncbi:glycine-rich domain-containing protein [Nonomuraea sp. bgisy101]|uniref:glycine-rich domain-containing protein n=1 Tax=Nonomuraea sp. bgisy101 TaxID=3413784 RepID=UPI003D7028B5
MTTSTTDTPTAGDVIDPTTTISAQLFDRLVARVLAEHPDFDDAYARRVMRQALAFLMACAFNPGARLAPSPQVDVGWHTFILFTRDYARFCAQVAGRVIHHIPEDEPATGAAAVDRIGVTITAMRAANLPVDVELWLHKAECSQCYQGCADDPSGA